MCIFTLAEFCGKSIYILKKSVSRDYPTHWHDVCEIEFVLSGKGRQILNGNEYPLHSGCMYMLTPADCHSVHPDTSLEIVGVMFEEKLLDQPLYERVLINETLGHDIAAELDADTAREVSGLLDILLNSVNGKTGVSKDAGEMSNMLVSRLLDCLVIKLLLSYSGGDKVRVASPIRTALLYLHSHYSESVTLDTLSGLTHLSRSYFSELFHETTGRTYKSYLIDLRMRAACRMLANTEVSVTEVCYACGFESFSNFMRTFKARYGKSPLVFRHENRREPMPNEKADD